MKNFKYLYKIKMKSNKSNKTKKRNNNNNSIINTTKKNKCFFLKSKLKPLPISFFKKISKQIIANNKIKQILQKYPFCSINNSINTFNEQIIIKILKNKSFTEKEKERRIIIALIDFAWQHITTGNADIGVLTNNVYCENKTFRQIK